MASLTPTMTATQMATTKALTVAGVGKPFINGAVTAVPTPVVALPSPVAPMATTSVAIVVSSVTTTTTTTATASGAADATEASQSGSIKGE